jgi:transposase
VALEGTLNKERYIYLLDQYLLNEMEHAKEEYGSDFLYMQDNAPPHVAKLTLKYLKNQKVRTLEWPPQSPDLNSLENLWAIVKRRLYSDHHMFRCRNDLIEEVARVWHSIPVSICEHLVTGVPNHLMEVLKTYGYPIK